VGELLGSIAFSLIVIAVIAGAWAWVSTLLRKGLMALLGFDRICVQQFETVLLYRNGRFEKALTPGRHRIRAGSRQLLRIDLRPEVFRFAQGAVSSDQIAVNLVYAARTQIVDPRAAFESTQNYRDEISIRLQSVVKAVCSRKPRLEVQTDHQSFSNSVQKAASQVLRSIGCECVTFELLQIDSAGPVAELDNSEWDLRRTSAWRPKAAAPVAGGPVGR
jgi:regulator of protease activity HflC (stomatin/prohibitin superfamily)